MTKSEVVCSDGFEPARKINSLSTLKQLNKRKGKISNKFETKNDECEEKLIE